MRQAFDDRLIHPRRRKVLCITHIGSALYCTERGVGDDAHWTIDKDLHHFNDNEIESFYNRVLEYEHDT